MPGRRVVRIAHGYGNRRDALAQALVADVDMIEVDIWYRGDNVWVRHERRLDPFPVLADHGMSGHPLPPWSVSLWKGYYACLDVNRLSLGEVLEATGDQKRLLLDTKGWYKDDRPRRFAETLARTIREHGAEESVAVCGQFYPVLNAFRRAAPDVQVRYSIQNARQWRWFVDKAGRDEDVRSICIQHRLVDDEKARVVEEMGIDLYCWTVDDRAEAARLVSQGVDGVISNDLGLLEELP